ncbi:hypothetical protein Ndes2526A_g00277 [Nannochloris sp. 'desiccata']
MNASRINTFWMNPLAYYLPLGEHIIATVLLLVSSAVANTALCQSPLLTSNFEEFSVLARKFQDVVGMDGLEQRYFQGQDSGIRHCICLITFIQLLLGAIASIWFSYCTEMSARSLFSQQQQSIVEPMAEAVVRFTEKEKTYFAMYDACGAWCSFIAVLPFLAVISWASTVLFVANIV